MTTKEQVRKNFEQLYLENETYWDKLTRISMSPHSRLMRTDHKTRHSTIYNIYLLNKTGAIIHTIEAKTMCAMEVINSANPACFTCEPRGKLRGLIHNR